VTKSEIIAALAILARNGCDDHDLHAVAVVYVRVFGGWLGWHGALVYEARRLDNPAAPPSDSTAARQPR
jgi:hypothetical protein